MNTRTEEDMMALILGFARSDELIRVVVMNGSRANPNVARDPFQDYDIEMFVTDIEPFRDETNVLTHFGKALVVEQPEAGPWPAGHGGYSYNMQLADGNRIDLGFSCLDALEESLKDSLTIVLLDKDKRIPSPAPSNESSYFITRPTEELFKGCCTGFFFALGSHIPKTIWRKNLPYLKFLIESWLREVVAMMFGWEIGIRSGWERSIGTKGRHLESLLPPDVWREYQKTYVGSDWDELWESLYLFHDIFSRSAEFVAEECGYSFPHEQSEKIRAFLEHVRALPVDAERIY